MIGGDEKCSRASIEKSEAIAVDPGHQPAEKVQPVDGERKFEFFHWSRFTTITALL